MNLDQFPVGRVWSWLARLARADARWGSVLAGLSRLRSPPRRLPAFEGCVDDVDNGMLIGWVYDRNDPGRRLLVDMYHKDRFLGTARANLFRGDLLQAGKGDGKHGFACAIPATLVLGEENCLHVWVTGTLHEVPRPGHLMDLRRRFSRLYIKGQGLEIGALHKPLWVPAGACVRYVDRMTLPELKRHYPELIDERLTPPDIVDDGEQLGTIPDDSQDFIVANHMLEHCENPLGTLRQHMRKLKPGGVLYCTVPDKRFLREADREETSFDHLVNDDCNGPGASRDGHFREWVVHMERCVQPDQVEARAQELKDRAYSIHFHAWTDATFREFLKRSREYLGVSFDVLEIQFNRTEVIAILRKR